MRYARKAIESDIVLTRHFEQTFFDFFAEIPSIRKIFLKSVDGFVGALQEFNDLVGAGAQFSIE